MRKIILFIFLIFIFIVRVNAYDNYKAGDILEYNGKEYYVLYDSDGKDNYLTLMYKDYLTQEEINKFGGNTIKSSTYLTQFFDSSSHYVTSDRFNQTLMKEILDKWSKDFSDDLVEVNGYKVRLLNNDDATNLDYIRRCQAINTFFTYYAKSTLNVSSLDITLDPNDHTKEIATAIINGHTYTNPFNPGSDGNFQLYCEACSGTDTLSHVNVLDYFNVTIGYYCDDMAPLGRSLSNPNHYEWLDGVYWTMIHMSIDGGPDNVFFSSGDEFEETNKDAKYGFRPVINLKKSVLGSKTDYNIGDTVEYRNYKFHVIKNTDNSEDYVVLFRDNLFTQLEVYSILYGNGYGYTSYYSNPQHCSPEGDYVFFLFSYNTSFVRNILNNWAVDNFNDFDLIKDINGEFVRLLSFDELKDNFAYEPGEAGYDVILTPTEDTPEWFIPNTPFWVKSLYESETGYHSGGFVLYPQIAKPDEIYHYQAVRPILTVSKCAFNDSGCNKRYCKEGLTPVYEEITRSIKNYYTGETIIINNEKYMVVEDSEIEDKNVYIVKLLPLSLEEVNKYVDGSFNSENGSIPYNLKCFNKYNETGEYDANLCNDSYDDSYYKKVVNNWALDKFKNYFYDSRLLTLDEVHSIFSYSSMPYFDYVNNVSFIKYEYTVETPLEIKDNSYITPAFDIINNETYFSYYGSDELGNLYFSYYVRPVISIDKCAIEGSCKIEQLIVGCLTPDGEIVPPEVLDVPVENTLSNLSLIMLLIGIFGVVSGFLIIMFYKNKSLK